MVQHTLVYKKEFIYYTVEMENATTPTVEKETHAGALSSMLSKMKNKAIELKDKVKEKIHQSTA